MTFLPVIQKEVKALARTFSLHESKAFVVWFAMTALDLDEDDAFDALGVEGSNDKGIDLFWVDHPNQRVLIAQCKYSTTGHYRPKEHELLGLLTSTEWLASPEALEREGRPELVAAARDYREAVDQDYSIQLWFAYCGEKDENINKRIRLFTGNPENEQHKRTAIYCDVKLLQSMYEEIRGGGQRVEQANIKTLNQAFEVSGSFGSGLVTSIEGSILGDLYNQFGDQLFARNVRGWLGARKGSVNASIIDTLQDARSRGNFWAFNNGVTIVCDKYEHNQGTGELTLHKFSIVNGGQTTVALALSKLPDTAEEVLVLVRVISPPEALIDSIIKFTNSQNLIRRWDLVSQDRTQARLKKAFAALTKPVYYDIRRGERQSLRASAEIT